MVFRYFPETDMLYIQLIDTISTDSEEVAPNIVLDFDENNRVIGIEIEDASEHVDLSTLEISAVPIISLVLNKQQTMVAA
ncbi:MAG: hypothetical protein DCC55_30390 [Chloroflexi bacterium]|nr:MAG: hypothetical protein DCC55_30390 [Chloroflexota bacterium]